MPLSPARAVPTSALLPLHNAPSCGSGLHMECGRTGCSGQLLCQASSGACARGGAPRAQHWELALLCPSAKPGRAASVPKAFPE